MKESRFNVLIYQGIYYLVTGLWPLINMNSFIYVTGPKTDLWLVKTISLLIVCIGITLLKGSSEKHYGYAINVLGISSAIAFLLIDLYYPLSEIISKIYLVDGIIQMSFIFLWGIVLIRRSVSAPRF